jgi:hypothetical protein
MTTNRTMFYCVVEKVKKRVHTSHGNKNLPIVMLENQHIERSPSLKIMLIGGSHT